MSLQDPVSDMLCHIRNGQVRARPSVTMASSTLKAAIANVLKEEGYIGGFEINDIDGKKLLSIELKYFEGKPVIERLRRISKPGRRSFKSKDKLPKILGGLGIAIVSTSKGVMTDKNARALGIGGEVLCIVA
jgi:small subunit ribosomal protein S8